MTTVRDARVSEKVERACAAADDATNLFSELSDVLHEAIPHDASTWFGVDPVTLLATAPSRIENLSGKYCDTYWHLEFHEHDRGLFVDLARGEQATAMQLAHGGPPTKSARYSDFMAPQNLDDELRAVFTSGGSTWGILGLYRSGGTFDERDVQLVKSISAPIAGALRQHVRELNPWLDQPSAPGMIVVDNEGRTVSANAEADCWLRELWPRAPLPNDFTESWLFDRRSLDNEVPTPIYALFARARAVAAGRERSAARLRVRDQRGRWVVIHASAMTGPGMSPGAVAMVIEAAKSAEIAPIIIDAYSLTPRERDVVAAIARGGSTSEIARALHLSPHTVRDHIKTVFDKFGVSSRNELVARLYGEHYDEPLKQSVNHVTT